MSKILFINLLMLVLLASLTACGGGGGSKTPPGPGVPPPGDNSSPIAGNEYRLVSFTKYDTDESVSFLELEESQVFEYGANNEQLRQQVNKHTSSYPQGRKALELEYTYSASDATETDIVTMQSFNSWVDAGNGERIRQWTWSDTWTNGNASNGTEFIETFDAFSGEILSEQYNQGSREFDAQGYVETNSRDFNADGVINFSQEYSWSNGNLQSVTHWNEDSMMITEERAYSYDSSNRLVELTITRENGEVEAHSFDYSQTGNVTKGIAVGLDGIIQSVKVEQLVYENAPCGEGVKKRIKAGIVESSLCVSW